MMILQKMFIELSPGDIFYTYRSHTVTKNTINHIVVSIDENGIGVSYVDYDGRYHQPDQAYATAEEAFRLGELE